MFHITAATTNSLSFSWQEPAIPNGVVTGYELSCHPLLLGIFPCHSDSIRGPQIKCLCWVTSILV